MLAAPVFATCISVRVGEQVHTQNYKMILFHTMHVRVRGLQAMNVQECDRYSVLF